MKLPLKQTVIAVALAIGTVGTASAGLLTLTFADNDGSSTWTTEGGLGGDFTAGNEFRVIASNGAVNDSQKDVFFGGETWTFGNSATSNITSYLMTGVSGTGSNVGATGQAPFTSAMTGFPLCATPGTCVSMQQGASFIFTFATFTMAAPIVGSIPADAFGAGHITQWTEDVAGGIVIEMPIIYTQWANGNYPLGADQGPIVFTGTANSGSGTFTLTGSYQMPASEVTVGGFATNYAQWQLSGSYVADHAVPVPAAVWLFGSGLLGLVGVARRKKSA